MTRSLLGSRILVIEDDFLIAEVVLELLAGAGAHALGPIGTVEDGLSFIAEHAHTLDHVILDLDLHGRKSYPIAQMLAGLRVPFIFVSGYSPGSVETPYRGFPHCEKPIRSAALLEMLCA